MQVLRDLHLWLVGSEELTHASASVCQVTTLSRDEDWAARLGERQPDFLLVEGVEDMGASWANRLDDLLSACEQWEIPRFLWITSSEVDPLFRLEPYTRIFSVGRDHVDTLRSAGDRKVSLLWPGTTVPAGARAGAEVAERRRDPVLWLGGWRRDWPDEWRASLFSLLTAARPHGLRIVDPADPDALPTDIRECIDPSPAGDPHSCLRGARIVIATDPAGTSRRYAPKVAFDAMACEAAVLTPHSFAVMFDFSRGAMRDGSWRHLVTEARDHDTAAKMIDMLLNDEDLHAETVETCRRVVEHNHTHAHRIATLASAANIRLVVEPQQR